MKNIFYISILSISLLSFNTLISASFASLFGRRTEEPEYDVCDAIEEAYQIGKQFASQSAPFDDLHTKYCGAFNASFIDHINDSDWPLLPQYQQHVSSLKHGARIDTHFRTASLLLRKISLIASTVEFDSPLCNPSDVCSPGGKVEENRITTITCRAGSVFGEGRSQTCMVCCIAMTRFLIEELRPGHVVIVAALADSMRAIGSLLDEEIEEIWRELAVAKTHGRASLVDMQRRLKTVSVDTHEGWHLGPLSVHAVEIRERDV